MGTLLERTGRRDEARLTFERAEETRQKVVAQLPGLSFEWRIGNGRATADHKIRINTAGDYRLYIKAAAYDHGSD